MKLKAFDVIRIIDGGMGARGANGFIGIVLPLDTEVHHGFDDSDIKVYLLEYKYHGRNGHYWGLNPRENDIYKINELKFKLSDICYLF